MLFQGEELFAMTRREWMMYQASPYAGVRPVSVNDERILIAARISALTRDAERDLTAPPTRVPDRPQPTLAPAPKARHLIAD